MQTRLTDADLIVVFTRADGNLLELGELETPMVELLRGVPGLVGVQRLRAGVSPRWQGEPRMDRVLVMGVPPEELERGLEYALEGRMLRQRMEGGEPLALRIRYDRRWSGGPMELAGAPVLGGNGETTTLGSLVLFRLVEEPTHIERREGQRVVRVGAQLDPAGPGPGATAAAVREALRAVTFPPGVSWWMEGEIEALEETRATFGVSMALALILVLTLLVIQYGTFSYALAGLLTIPMAGGGAVLLLALLGRPLDGMVLAGLLIAVGIVANNVILVLSQAQDLEGRGMGPGEALASAGVERLRPITLTVLSTVLGMSPLLLGGARAFGLLQPLAIALIGSLLLSIPLACFILPTVARSLRTLGSRGFAREGRSGR